VPLIVKVRFTVWLSPIRTILGETALFDILTLAMAVLQVNAMLVWAASYSLKIAVSPLAGTALPTQFMELHQSSVPPSLVQYQALAAGNERGRKLTAMIAHLLRRIFFILSSTLIELHPMARHVVRTGHPGKCPPSP
jgi:hypothetical protein